MNIMYVTVDAESSRFRIAVFRRLSTILSMMFTISPPDSNSLVMSSNVRRRIGLSYFVMNSCNASVTSFPVITRLLTSPISFASTPNSGRIAVHSDCSNESPPLRFALTSVKYSGSTASRSCVRS